MLILTIVVSSFLTGCRIKGRSSTSAPDITLTFYGLYDTEDVYQPIIQAYESENRNVDIVYKKFTDPGDYLDLIVNELAEGEGPDIFMMHNTWFPKHYKKLTPAPSTVVDTEIFKSLYVDIVENELIIPDENGAEQVWGMPIYVDTLALYYNDDHIEDALPSQGTPSKTWAGIAQDVVQLTKADNSFERFERAGIALGRGDNILRAFDIVMMMFLQYKVDFYNEDLTTAIFGSNEAALAALDLYTSFGLPSQKNYSWNAYIAEADSGEKELTAFANGKVSMILGYSYTYEDIASEIVRLGLAGEKTIDLKDVKTQEVPQVYDPDTSAETREAYASYFVPAVSRTTENSEEAWKFLASLADEDNLRYYNEKTHRPSALRNLITEQMSDPIYGVFAAQVGYAESIPMSDPEAYEELFLEAIDQIINTARSKGVLSNLEDAIQALIPSSGIKPTYVSTE